MRNHEVMTEQLLLDEQGEIREPGWSRKMYQQYRRKMIKAPSFRIKEWDYYLVTGKDFACAFTISDNGYVGLQSVSLLIFDDMPREHTETVLNVMPMGKLHMPETSAAGNTVYTDQRLQMTYTAGKNTRKIRCHFENFMNGKPLNAEIELEQPEMDSLVIATPWDKKHAFYFNQKINCMPASGYVEFDGVRREFDPQTDFGTLDWGRGVWTYDNTWYWSSGNARINGKAFGFNLGYGFGNTTAATENVIHYDGKAHKLDDITFSIPANYTDPWKVTSSDGRFEADFVPVLDRAVKLDFKVIVSDQHQVFGRMSGKAVLDDGEVITFNDLLCFAEEVHNKY